MTRADGITSGHVLHNSDYNYNYSPVGGCPAHTHRHTYIYSHTHTHAHTVSDGLRPLSNRSVQCSPLETVNFKKTKHRTVEVTGDR